jgi:phosphatidate phosphatase APP1
MATVSESRVNITVYVSYGMSSVSDANVTISSNTGGNFNRTWTLTDSNGYANFAFTTPPANTAINVSLAVRASKDGYVDAENQLNITVGPATLNLIVDVSPTITSGETTVVGVHVVSNATRIVRAIANASVTVTATDGSFQVNNATTDSNGYCEFSFTSPGTTTQISITITTNATKNGYISTGNQTTIIVNPIPPTETGGGGWSLLTMLLIIIPIVIAAVVIIVLIKRKVIRFSVEEDET